MAKNRNGEGSLYKMNSISGPRWQATTTVGKDNKGKLIRIAGTGKTQAEAIARRQKNLVRYLQKQNSMPSAYEGHRVSEINLTVARMLHKWLAQLNREKSSTTTCFVATSTEWSSAWLRHHSATFHSSRSHLPR
jgi:hypothetical protein